MMDVNRHESESIAKDLPLRPDDLVHFRLGRLLVLLDVVQQQQNLKPLDIERLGYYDFFAASPFLIFGPESREYRNILLAGFEVKNLSYQSSAQRFTNRRARLQYDLALLISYGTVHAAVSQKRVTYDITQTGQGIVSSMQAMYAFAYRRSASITVSYLNKLGDGKLQEEAKHWLKAESLLIDVSDLGLH